MNREEVVKVALLARLKLTDDELDRFTSQLGQVLQYVDILNEVETEDVEPMAHAVELFNVFRDDEVRESLARDEALSNAPETDGQCFLVPPILDGGS
jgi:aspartyl-tRNA(Asn)/glutamyl-tRNA(Gln) amidotransferase subunit C